MPRPKRAAQGGYCYHVLSRGNGRQRVFRKDRDYDDFLCLFDEAQERHEMRIIAYCLMPNHFHLVLWPVHDGDLSRWMQWVLTTHVRRYHEHYLGSGHIWQGRFKAFPIQADDHLLTVLRYVERNPLRANLVTAAEDWRWSSLGRDRRIPDPTWLVAGPVPRGRTWRDHVNRFEPDADLAAIRHSIRRGTPFGSDTWRNRTVLRLGLQSTLNPRGRPRSFPK